MHKKILVSIIIVHYKVELELFACLSSITNARIKLPYEIIVVDNDEKKNVEDKLKSSFPYVKYFSSRKNTGYGGGNNFGAKKAKGKYLFFLNPDTLVEKNTIGRLESYLSKHETVAIVAPSLFDLNGNKIPQGTGTLGFLEGIFCLSFINKLFPTNRIARRFFLQGADKTKIYPAETVAGTALMIRKDVFEKVGGFDEHLFLFFEEFDICRRVRSLGYKIMIVPSSRIKHVWGGSMKKSRYDIASIFRKSRFYYFKKYYGFPIAVVVNNVASLCKIHLLLLTIIIFSVFFRFYKLSELMPFIGDQGWFYISARDMILTGKIPFVGIASSHPWIHQGPLWTYLLAIVLWLFKFNPVAGGYLSAFIDVITVYLMFYVGKNLFSEKVGVIASLLYAVSPLAVVFARFPYHTSPIPLFSLLLLFAFVNWMRGYLHYFPIVILILSILYNFELATFVMAGNLLIVVLYGFFKKKKWLLKLANKKTFFLSIVAFIIPMSPFLLYDMQHGFPQTVKFIAWIGYRILVLFGYPALHPEVSSATVKDIVFFLEDSAQNLLFLPSKSISFFFIFIGFAIFIVDFVKKIKLHSVSQGYLMLVLNLMTLLVTVFLVKTLSYAYLPMFIPGIIFLISIGFVKIYEIEKYRQAMIFAIISIVIGNTFFFMDKINLDKKSGFSFLNRVTIVKRIIKESNGRKYNLLGVGPGSKFRSFTSNYAYLTWWLGTPESDKKETLKFVISENREGIYYERGSETQ